MKSERFDDLIAVTAASLVFVAALSWLAAAVYLTGEIVGRPWMLGHGPVNDILLILACVMFLIADFCCWFIVRKEVGIYLRGSKKKC